MNQPTTSRLQQSLNTTRALTQARPSLRGLSHRVAAVLIIPATILLVALARPGLPRFAVALYGATSLAVFTASAIVHLRPWPPERYEVLFRLDHTGIYLHFGGTATAIAIGVLDGSAQAAVIIGMWGAVTLGLIVEWLPFAPPRGFSNTVFLTMGWINVLLVPAIHGELGWTGTALFLGGGIVYSVGAAIVGLQRPDPWPETFGYHEIWHVLVIVAIAMHAALVLLPLR